MKVSVIIPAYNEGKNIPLLVHTIAKTFKKHKINGEIILTDDGSTDNTGKLLVPLKRKYNFLKVFKHKVRKGLTEALMTCFKNSKGEVIIFLPGDLESHPDEDIPKLHNKMKEGYDMVVGWRKNRKGLKLVSSGLYNLLSRLLFGIKLHDINWIKSFSRDVMNELELRSDWHRYLPVIASSKGYKVGEVKVNYYKRKYGKSKFGLSRLLIGFLDLIALRLIISFGEKPMLVFGPLGIFLLLLSFIGGIHLILTQINLGSIGNRPLLFLVVLLGIMGIQLFAMGFLAEQIANIKQRIKK